MTSNAAEPGRLIIVSNRLPFIAGGKNGELTFQESTGGVVTGLRTYLDTLKGSGGKEPEYLWVGWPGAAIDEPLRDQLKAKALSDFHSLPVFLSEEEMEHFYHGFCNKTIWPLFHYFPTYTTFNQEDWEHYRRVNEVFCDAILENLQERDTVWIHDYHLMLLPGLLQARTQNASIGFFLHIPFPSFEVFHLLPSAWRREILEGLLGADLVGFHTYSYLHHFLQCVLRIHGYENNMGQILLPNRVVKAETFPMGIDFKKFHGAIGEPEVQQERETLRKSLPGAKIVLSVDRLDYTKGIINRLHGFELLLDKHPEFRERVTLIMIVVPSRIGVNQYEQMKKQIEEAVGKINGKFGSISWTPIIYQYRYLSFAPLVALYSVSDIALVTPLRDGMNLVAKEYVASRADASGVLVLSEMAGAAKELGEAIIINPNYTEEIAQALRDALELPLEEQKRRNRVMQNRLRRYDVVRWAQEFLGELLTAKSEQEKLEARILPATERDRLVARYKEARSRLILLDYDGTLVPFTRSPQQAMPGRQVLGTLEALSGSPRNTVVLISGRDRRILEQWFNFPSLGLAAEHGAWIRERGGRWELLKQQTGEWKARILPILEHYADRLPGAHVEEKEFSLVWHYRAAHPEQARMLAQELVDHLVTFTANIDVQVIQGSKIIEVRTAGVNKGEAGRHWLGKGRFDFVLAIGDDTTDEDLFAVLGESAYTIRVGVTTSRARFNLPGTEEVLDLLKSLATAGDPRSSGVRPGDFRQDAASATNEPRHGRGGKLSTARWLIGFAVLPLAARLLSKIASSSWLKHSGQ